MSLRNWKQPEEKSFRLTFHIYLSTRICNKILPFFILLKLNCIIPSCFFLIYSHHYTNIVLFLSLKTKQMNLSYLSTSLQLSPHFSASLFRGYHIKKGYLYVLSTLPFYYILNHSDWIFKFNMPQNFSILLTPTIDFYLAFIPFISSI